MRWTSWWLGVLAVVGPVAGQTAVEPLPSPWFLASQAYTFRDRTLTETIDTLAALGIGYVEAYPGQRVSPELDEKFQPGCSPAAREAVKAKLTERGVELVAFGVVGLPGNEAGVRRVFDFCREMGVKVVTSEPNPEHLPLIDGLCEEYDVRVAIHNHPAPSKYADPAVLLAALEGVSPRIGACADVGHWARSGHDPVESLRQLEGRLVSLHFKDVSVRGERRARDVIWGTGAVAARECLAELQRQGWGGVIAIEYEHMSDKLVGDVAQCVEWYRATVAALTAAG